MQTKGTIPVELVGDANPAIPISGRDPLVFRAMPEYGGRRLEFVTEEVAEKLTSHPYNRGGQPKMFEIVRDLPNPEMDEEFDERVLKSLGRMLGVPTEDVLPVLRGQVGIDPPPVLEEEGPGLAQMSRPELMRLARDRDLKYERNVTKDELVELLEA